jgi:hypothetical protein
METQINRGVRLIYDFDVTPRRSMTAEDVIPVESGGANDWTTHRCIPLGFVGGGSAES